MTHADYKYKIRVPFKTKKPYVPYKERKYVTLYTDGSCIKGNGGWCAILVNKSKQVVNAIYGNKKETTNNQMELLAVIKGLKTLKTPHTVYIVSDSKYIVDSINNWLQRWVANGFLRKRKQIKNVNYWKQYIEASHIHRIKGVWVKAHNGNKYNEYADRYAVNAAIDLVEYNNMFDNKQIKRLSYSKK